MKDKRITRTETTHDKSAEEQVTLSQEKFSRIFHSSPIALSVTRFSDGMFFDMNQSFQDLFGYERKKMLGHGVNEIIMFNDSSDLQEIIHLLERDGKVFNREVTARTKAGTEVNVLISAEKIKISNNTPIRNLLFNQFFKV